MAILSVPALEKRDQINIWNFYENITIDPICNTHTYVWLSEDSETLFWWTPCQEVVASTHDCSATGITPSPDDG